MSSTMEDNDVNEELMTSQPASSDRKWQKILMTSNLYATFFGTGLAMALFGATLLDLELQTGCSTDKLAILYTFMNLGRLPGVVLMGAILERANHKLIMAASVGLMAVTMATIPFCSHFVSLAIVMVVNGAGVGFLGGASNVLMLQMWEERAGQLLQGMFFSFAVGSTIAPLLAKPFLIRTRDLHNYCHSIHNLTRDMHPHIDFKICTNVKILQLESMVSEISESATALEVHGPDLNATFEFMDENVSDERGIDQLQLTLLHKYPFYIVGALNGCIALLFIILFLKYRGNDVMKSDQDDKEKNTSVVMTIIYMTCLIIFLAGHGGMEITYGGLILTYAVQWLTWTKSNATILTSVYWGLLAIGRLIGIFLAGYVGPLTYMMVNSIGALVALVILACAGSLHTFVPYACAVMQGLFIATNIGNAFVLARNLLDWNSRKASVLVTSIYTGMLGVPALTSVALKLHGISSFLYVILSVATVMLLSLIVIHFVRKRQQLSKNQMFIQKDLVSLGQEEVNSLTSEGQKVKEDSLFPNTA